MASSGPNNPSSASDGGGGRPWSGPTNVYADDGNYATEGGASSGNYWTNNINVSGFGFAIPGGATIDGILVEMKRVYTLVSGSQPYDRELYMLKAGSAAGSNYWGTGWLTTEAYQSVGGASDLWGTTWTPSDVNNAGFGITLSVTIPGNAVYQTLYFNHARVTVYYTAAASGGRVPQRRRRFFQRRAA